MAAKKRSSRLIAIGLAVFVVGVGLALVALRALGFQTSSSTATSEPTGQHATENPTSEEAETENDEPNDPAPAAVRTNPQQRLPAKLEIPSGREAVAFQIPFDAGAAGLPGPGDRVNVYGVFTKRQGGPMVKLFLSDVEVLGTVGPSANAGGGTPTVVLALTTEEAEEAILVHTAERAWLSLTPPNATTSSTSGADYGSVLQ